MKHKMYTLGIVIVISGLVISGCKVSTVQPTDPWNTYVNEKYGYSFNYPADYFYGPMPSDCKQKPPEDRRSECLRFLNSENPDDVFMQGFLGEGDQLSLAGFSVSRYDSPLFNPPPGTALTSWLKESFSETGIEIPDEPNMEIDGVSAVRIYSPQSPMAPSYEEIYFMKNNLLFRINMYDADNEDNKRLYDHILTSFSIEE